MKKIIAVLAVAFSALAANAADIVWTGNAGDGKWETDGNWEGGAKPTGADYAKFGKPYADDLTVTISDTVQAYGLSTASSRTGNLMLTGNGLLEITSDYLRANANGLVTWDVNVTNTIDNKWVSLYGDNTFLRRLDMIGGDSGNTLCIRNNSTLRLANSASALTKYINLQDYTNPSIYLEDSASLEVLRDLTLKADATLSVSDDATLTVRNIFADSKANVSFTGGTISLTQGSGSSNAITNTNLIAANSGTVLNISGTTYNIIDPFSNGEDEWILNGGEIHDISGTENGGYGRISMMALTNTTKAITGTGILQIGQLYPSTSSNLVIRLDGPDLYARLLSRSGYGDNISFAVSGGSTVGAWGGNPSLQYWTTLIDGEATFDTTDYGDGETARTITFGDFGDANGNGSDGTMILKGNGTAILNTGGRWTYKIPDLSITAKDSVAVSISGIPIYAAGDITLQDNASFTSESYFGHKGTPDCVKSLTLSGTTSLKVKRYVQLSGDATLSSSSMAVIRNENNDNGAAFTCANLSLSDDASLVVTGQIAAATLSMSGNAHLEFTAGSSFTAGSTFGDGNWTMSITIPSDYEAGIHPIVKGVEFDDDFADHVTITGATEGWSVKVLDGTPALCKDAVPEGLEWTGNSESSQNWSDTANWNGGTLPTSDDKIAFGGTKGLEPFDNDYLTSVSGMVFRASAGPFVVTGSVDSLTMTENFPNGSRSNIAPDNAVILSLSDFDQEIALPVSFTGNAALLAMSGGSITLSRGITTAASKWFAVGGEVRLGGESAADYLAFNSKYTTMTSTLRLLPGATFTARRQGYRSFTDEANYVGRFIIEEGATMNVVDGDCSSWNGGLEYVVNGTLKVYANQDTGRLTASSVDQYYAGSGEIYADSARSARFDSTAKYINFGGTLKLYMNGNWYTATYEHDGDTIFQNPNYPTRFRMTDGTTLGATKDWTYGPRDTAYDTIANTLTPAQRASIMTGTVTVNTQSPKDDAAHTITFVDPLDASEATLVKAGAGTLMFNEPENYPSQIGHLTVNAGTVHFGDTAPVIGRLTVADGATARFAAAPTLTSRLTVASTGSKILSGDLTPSEWRTVATAPTIVGPDGATEWKASFSKARYRIASSGNNQVLQGRISLGLTVIVR